MAWQTRSQQRRSQAEVATPGAILDQLVELDGGKRRSESRETGIQVRLLWGLGFPALVRR
jgi:hypothetical protein